MKPTHLTRYLRERRIELGLTQREVAEQLGYRPQFVTNWECGRSSPPDHALRTLCKVLRIRRDAMLGLLVADATEHFETILRGRLVQRHGG